MPLQAVSYMLFLPALAMQVYIYESASLASLQFNRDLVRVVSQSVMGCGWGRGLSELFVVLRLGVTSC